MSLFCGSVGSYCESFPWRLLPYRNTYIPWRPILWLYVRIVLLRPLVMLTMLLRLQQCLGANTGRRQPPHFHQLNSWWVCVKNAQRLFRITSLPIVPFPSRSRKENGHLHIQNYVKRDTYIFVWRICLSEIQLVGVLYYSSVGNQITPCAYSEKIGFNCEVWKLKQWKSRLLCSATQHTQQNPNCPCSW